MLKAWNLVFVQLIYLFFPIITSAIQTDCVPKSIGSGNTVCVCNATYCDTLGDINPPSEKGDFVLYVSSKQGLRMNKKLGTFKVDGHHKPEDAGDKAYAKIYVNRDRKRQAVLGFGGAFTDAAGINILDLPEDLQKTLMSAYYGPEGIGYSIGRIPMGGCDFSTHPYTYADHPAGDVTLSNFSLQTEDHTLKIPFLAMAKTLNPDLLLYGSPWSAPPWMKSNNDYVGRGLLNPEHYQAWADYFVKFLKSYEEEGFQMWGVTAQNEPMDGLFPYFPFNSMGWTPTRQRTWIKDYLGPTLHKNGYENLKVMILDDNTILLPMWPQKVFSDPEASKYISGIAIHWYTNQITKYCGLNSTAYEYPDKFILGSEACQGFFFWQKKVDFGSWKRGEGYSEDIIRDLENGVVGWTDWNLALDLFGGPNWAGLGADSPIIINKTSGEFYKQPMFYALAHISKFFLRYSEIIETEVKNLAKGDQKLYIVGALRPDKAIAIALLNKDDNAITINVKDENRGSAMFILPPKSMGTLLYA